MLLNLFDTKKAFPSENALIKLKINMLISPCQVDHNILNKGNHGR